MTDWPEYNPRNAGRITILIDGVSMKDWEAERDRMNRGKAGRPYRYPEGLIMAIAKLRAFLKLTCRHTMDLIKYLLPGKHAPDYTTIYRRICSLRVEIPRIEPRENMVLAVDSTGISVKHGGEWLYAKHRTGNKRAFIKLHIGIDVDTGEIVACEITKDMVHDSQCMEKLVSQAERDCEIKEVLADGGYDTNPIFQKLSDKDIEAVIRVRVNSRSDTGCSARQLVVMAQVYRYDEWKKETGYGRRTSVERVFAVFKKVFGEGVRVRKVENIIKEILIKVLVYNQFAVLHA